MSWPLFPTPGSLSTELAEEQSKGPEPGHATGGSLYLGISTLEPLMEENVIGAENVGSKGIPPDGGVRGLVQVGQVLQGALTEVLQG